MIRRLFAAVCTSLVLVGAVLFFTGRTADARASAAGSGNTDTLAFFQIDAAASGWGFTEQYSGYGEGYVPRSASSLTTGPIGYGLSSVAWPGAAGGNVGTLILGLNPSAPPQSKQLDYPVRAEARTGQDPPTTTNDSYPGVSMASTATADLVESAANVQSTESPAGTFGTTRSAAKSTLSGTTALAESIGEVHDVALAGGQIKIESVVTTASAQTDGVNGQAVGGTTVTGMTIGGQPATVDENGVRIGPASGPANDVVNQIAQQTIKNAGIEFVVSKPTVEVQGSSAKYTAGSLRITWSTPNGAMTVIFGGATAAVDGSVGSNALLEDLTSFDDSFLTEDAPLTDDSFTPAPADVAAPIGDSFTSSQPLASPATTAAPRGVLRPQAQAFPAEPVVAVTKGLSAPLVLMALGTAGLMALGMRRLSSNVLAEGGGVGCPLDD